MFTKPQIFSDETGSHVLGKDGSIKASFSIADHGESHEGAAVAHLQQNFDSYMGEEIDKGLEDELMSQRQGKSGKKWRVERAGKTIGSFNSKDKADVKAMKHPLNKVVANEAVGEITVKKMSSADAYKKHTGQMTAKTSVPKDPKTGKTLYQKVTSEAKDSREYDYEGEMVLNQLQQMTHHVEELKSKLKPNTNLPEWVQLKITLAADYIQTAADYLSGEMKEEVQQVDEIAPIIAAVASRVLPAIAGNAARAAATRAGASALGRSAAEFAGQAVANKAVSSLTSNNQPQSTVREDAEQIDELSKKTLGNYAYRAASELGSRGITTGLKIAADEPTEKNFKKMGNRQKGVATAVKKLTKEEAEQVDEAIDTMSDARIKYHATKNFPHGKYSSKEIKAEHERRQKSVPNYHTVKASLGEEAEQIDELSRKTLSAYQAASKEEGRKNRLSPSGASSKVTKRTQGADLAMRKSLSAVTGKRLANVPATNEEAKNPYAVGMAAAMKSTGDKPPLKKSTIVKAHKIAKNVMKENKFLTGVLNKLEEGRGRPPKEGSAAWHRQQAASAAGKPKEEPAALGMQLRKAKSINAHVEFDDGKKHEVHPSHVDRFEDHMAARKTSQEKAAFQKRASASHEAFKKAVSEPLPNSKSGGSEVVKYRH